MTSSASRRFRLLAAAAALSIGVSPALAQTSRPALPPSGAVATSQPSRFDAGLQGRNVEQIRVAGNSQTPTAVILNAVRTREGTPLDQKLVEEDYQRIYALRKFSDVDAKVEPTVSGGVIVVFSVVEQRKITSLGFLGNAELATPKIRDSVDLREGENIDGFRIALARQGIERVYREANFPFASVTVDQAKLDASGELVFNVVEGPNVRVRKISFPGNQSFEKDTLMDKVKSRSWIFVFRNGKLDFETLEDDVGALRRFYESKGFFDVRVGRRLRFSENLSEVQVDFVIDEGRRYVVDKIEFQGIKAIDEPKFREDLKLKEGGFYDKEYIDRDVRQFVKLYAPYGYVYQAPGTPAQVDNPDYLHISPTQVFQKEPGKLTLVYKVEEGKPFRTGRIIIKGNQNSMDKLAIRELHVQPGELYNSSELQDATDRLKSVPYFKTATITPIGDDPNYRDVLVEVSERDFRQFQVGAGVNSNGGLGANLSYDHRNFDVGRVPDSFADTFTDRAFTGAGQRFRVSIEPGTEFSNASVLFSEPYVFDSPFSFTNEYYYRDRVRPDWRETRLGGRVSIGHQFDYEDSISATFKAEDVEVWDIDNFPLRALDVQKDAGHSLLTTYGLAFNRNTTNRGPIAYKGYSFRVSDEQSAPPGEFSFNKVGADFTQYVNLTSDLLERRTVLSLHADTGYIFGGAPFFERFYAGGIGSIRGFRYRGVSPRQGLEDDAVGGKFILDASAEVSYPIAGDFLRGVVFTDTGTVNNDVSVGNYRVAVGTGFRLYLPFFGQAPFALDFAVPLSKDGQDETQLVSFSFGFNP